MAVNTYVEFRIYTVTDLSADVMASTMDDVIGVKTAYEVRYVACNFGDVEPDSRLFEKKIDLAIKQMQSDYPKIVDITYRLISEREFPRSY